MSDETSAPAKDHKLRDDDMHPSAKPEPDRYRSEKIRIHPVANLDPQGDYQNQLMVYLPRRPDDSASAEALHPWRIEVEVPFLPGDRFSCLFEQYWNAKMQVVSRNFSLDRTIFEMQAVLPGETAETPGQLSIKVEVKGGLDFIDLVYLVKNTGPRDLPSTTETCFPTLTAPSFRDHDGTRTMVMTREGFKSIKDLPRPPNLRLLIQDYLLRRESARPSDEASGVTGPLIAIVSRDRRWLVAAASLSGAPTRLVNNREYSCIHCNPPSQVKPGEEIEVRERIYFLRGSLEELQARYAKDLAEAARGEERTPGR